MAESLRQKDGAERHFLCLFLIAKRVISFASGMVKKGMLLLLTIVLFGGLLLSELVFHPYAGVNH